jgi:hypothetical protein
MSRQRKIVSWYQRTWKGLAIIMVSYDECGAPEKVDNFGQT